MVPHAAGAPLDWKLPYVLRWNLDNFVERCR